MSLAVITSYSLHNDQYSCCVMALSSSTTKILDFIFRGDLLAVDTLSCNDRTDPQFRRNVANLPRLRSSGHAQCEPSFTLSRFAGLHLWTDFFQGQTFEVISRLHTEAKKMLSRR